MQSVQRQKTVEEKVGWVMLTVCWGYWGFVFRGQPLPNLKGDPTAGIKLTSRTSFGCHARIGHFACSIENEMCRTGRQPWMLYAGSMGVLHPMAA